MIALLDTHVLLWWLGAPDRLSNGQREVIEAADGKEPLRVSEITLWEVAMLQSLGRIRLHLPLREWLTRATSPPLVVRHGISPEVAAEVAGLPETFHRDPADRIIVATARVLGATLLTSDRKIIDARLVPTLE